MIAQPEMIIPSLAYKGMKFHIRVNTVPLLIKVDMVSTGSFGEVIQCSAYLHHPNGCLGAFHY